ncbi:hypothetical protein [uncultured Leptotrichia sp.]|jgi:hypothetical protein|uniref:hypothetical protein n=1 Tax=uncultured Leptotrichia sp. TaxID=159271 RepID=UPI002617F606|nr:hypothetical protein [uncultured Leptotrichia sp.]
MKYLIRVKIIVLLLSIMLLTNSCVEMYCALSDSVSDFCYGVRRRENEKMDKREEKIKEREHRKKMEEINKNKE